MYVLRISIAFLEFNSGVMNNIIDIIENSGMN